MARRLVLGSMVVALLLATAACGDDAEPESTTNAATSSSTSDETVQVAKTGLGDVLVDDEGMTLYLFTKDSDGASACTGDCATTWPPLRAAGESTAGKGLDATKLGTLARADGGPQVTFAGKPLYRYAPDKKAGDVNGQGVGGVWFAVRPDGTQASANAGATSGVPSY